MDNDNIDPNTVDENWLYSRAYARVVHEKLKEKEFLEREEVRKRQVECSVRALAYEQRQKNSVYNKYPRVMLALMALGVLATAPFWLFGLAWAVATLTPFFIFFFFCKVFKIGRH